MKLKNSKWILIGVITFLLIVIFASYTFTRKHNYTSQNIIEIMSLVSMYQSSIDNKTNLPKAVFSKKLLSNNSYEELLRKVQKGELTENSCASVLTAYDVNGTEISMFTHKPASRSEGEIASIKLNNLIITFIYEDDVWKINGIRCITK